MRPQLQSIMGCLVGNGGQKLLETDIVGKVLEMRSAILADIHSNLAAFQAVWRTYMGEVQSTRYGASGTWSATVPIPKNASNFCVSINTFAFRVITTGRL